MCIAAINALPLVQYLDISTILSPFLVYTYCKIVPANLKPTLFVLQPHLHSQSHTITGGKKLYPIKPRYMYKEKTPTYNPMCTHFGAKGMPKTC